MRNILLCKTFSLLSILAPCFLVSTVMGLIAFLGYKGIPSLSSTLFFGNTGAYNALFGARPVWDGIWIACLGSFSLVALTLFFVLVPAIACGVYLAEYASAREQKYIGALIEMLAGTPSILMGFAGFLLILFLRKTFFPHATTCLLLASLCLAFLVLPVLVLATYEALKGIPQSLRQTALVLGFSPAEALYHVLLPAASRGIVAGVILATGRIAEDTAVILLTGVVASTGFMGGLFDKFEALPFYIYYIAAEYRDETELLHGFAASFLLLSFSVLLLFTAKMLRSYWQKRK